MYEEHIYAQKLRELGQQRRIHEIGLTDYADGQPLPHELFDFLKDSGVFQNLAPDEKKQGVHDIGRWLVALREVGALDNTSVHIMTTQSMPIYALQLAGETERLRQQLWNMISLEKAACFCMTEPSGGSDAANLSASASRVKGGYCINGEKCMIMNAGFADYFLILARLSDVEGYDGFTLFLADRQTEGLEVLPHTPTCGVTGVPINPVIFHNMFLPKDRAVGGEGNGWKLVMSVLNHTRPGVGAAALGAARTAMERAAAFGQHRICFGKPLNKNAVLQGKFAGMSMAWDAAWLLVERAGRNLDAHGPAQTSISAMAKIAGTEAAKQIVDQALDFFGGYGYLTETGMERFYRDIRTTPIYDGSNDILRGLVAGIQLKNYAGHI
ncbi:acyl-CoA dehydrogenase family protein [uncultured Oscillibacter sp.]|uniref:acyl-CoA dehydrogenase family protein n=1 Tax=uncultured Oscillibacter sp. TaxID=876091 RepID=UPI0026217A78|nr:acyl-CoA dehydrogenase [uncultured Oscillibacter sp.]